MILNESLCPLQYVIQHLPNNRSSLLSLLSCSQPFLFNSLSSNLRNKLFKTVLRLSSDQPFLFGSLLSLNLLSISPLSLNLLLQPLLGSLSSNLRNKFFKKVLCRSSDQAFLLSYFLSLLNKTIVENGV